MDFEIVLLLIDMTFFTLIGVLYKSKKFFWLLLIFKQKHKKNLMRIV